MLRAPMQATIAARLRHDNASGAGSQEIARAADDHSLTQPGGIRSEVSRLAFDPTAENQRLGAMTCFAGLFPNQAPHHEKVLLAIT